MRALVVAAALAGLAGVGCANGSGDATQSEPGETAATGGSNAGTGGSGTGGRDRDGRHDGHGNGRRDGTRRWRRRWYRRHLGEQRRGRQGGTGRAATGGSSGAAGHGAGGGSGGATSSGGATGAAGADGQRPLRSQQRGVVPLPTIGSGTFNVTTYGAVDDGKTDNTTAIQAALTAAGRGGRRHGHSPVRYFSLGSDRHQQRHAPRSRGGRRAPDVADGELSVRARRPSSRPPAPPTTSRITGSGTIDGQGQAWWDAFADGSSISRPQEVSLGKVTRVQLERHPSAELARGAHLGQERHRRDDHRHHHRHAGDVGQVAAQEHRRRRRQRHRDVLLQQHHRRRRRQRRHGGNEPLPRLLDLRRRPWLLDR